MDVSAITLTVGIVALAFPPKTATPEIPRVNYTVIEGLPIKATEEGIELIVDFEVGGKAYYAKAYQRPVWPGHHSGVTWAIGYDAGYNTKAQIKADWGPYVDKATLSAMVSCAGIAGSSAKWKRQEVRWKISIPLDIAMKVFIKRTVPRFAAMTKRAYPNIEFAPPPIQDMVLSESFNRGTSIRGNSRRHILWQTQASAKREYDKMPQHCRDSEVVWRGKLVYNGLKRRRYAEADHGEGRGKYLKN